MSKINKIKVNGTPYEVEDKEAVKTVTLTQAEYDALQTKDPSIFYVISDGQGGGGGMTSGEVQTMIDASISGKADSSGVTQEISAATSGKVDTTTFNTYSGAVDTALSGKQETLVSGTNIKTINNESILGSGNITISGGGSGSSAVEVTQAEYDALVSGGTLDPSVLYIIKDAVGGDLSNYMTSAQTMNAISAATSTKQDILSAGTGIDITDNTISVTGGGITSGEVQDMIDTSISGKQDTLSAGTNITITDNVISAQLEGGTVSKGDVEDMIEEATSGLQETLSAGTGIEIDSANTISCTVSGKTYSAGTNISIDANDTIKCTIPIKVTQGLYDYHKNVIINEGGTITDGSQSLAVGYINTIKNKFYSVTLGSSNVLSSNTSSTNAVVAIGSGNKIIGDGATYNSVACGYNNHISGGTQPSNVELIAGYGTRFVCGNHNEALNGSQFVGGYYNKTYNFGEFCGGVYNNSVSASTTFGDSGNTLFSVGNGTANNARHNAFEIKQNGDIYITSGSTDIKLQDHLGGGGGGGMTEDDELLLSTALTDLNDRKIDASEVKANYQKKGDYVTTSTLNTRLSEYETALDEQNVEEVTAYALNDLNSRFGGLSLVKITESEYAALTTKDENTLYVVVADPE